MRLCPILYSLIYCILTILAKFISLLERIEDGEIDQHEGSYLVGKLLKELYIDSALKKSEALDEKNAKLDKQKEAEIIKPKHKISWKEFKISQTILIAH